MSRISRRSLVAGGALLPLALAAPGAANPPVGSPAAAPGVPPEFPRQDSARVAEAVGVSHRDLDRVRALVEETPALANATWDWGFGDWESALGAASHVGRRDIAEYLLSRGARPTVFSAAMLGQLAVVRAFVEADPAVLSTPGPHGIPLLEHARAGGERAGEVLRYLESMGAACRPSSEALGPEQSAAYFGRYGYGADADDVLEVAERGGSVTLLRERSFARLVPAGSHTFHPAGAPAVRIVFAVAAAGAPASSLTVHDGPLVATATRLPSAPAPAS